MEQDWVTTVANQRPLSNGVTFQTACIHSYDCEPVKGSWLRSQINCGLGTVDRLCAVSMGLVCTHTSGSSEWKAYVSARQWLNDTTYRPNSHSGSCTYFWKNNTNGNPTNRESLVSVRSEMFDLLWSFFWVKIEFCWRFSATGIVW